MDPAPYCYLVGITAMELSRARGSGLAGAVRKVLSAIAHNALFIAIMLGFLFEFLAMMAFIRVSDFIGYAVAWAMFGLGIGLMSPAYQSLISKAVPEKMLGTAFGFLQTSLGVVSLPAPWIGAQLWERVSPRFTFSLTAWFGLLAIIPVYFKFKLPEDDKQVKTDQ